MGRWMESHWSTKNPILVGVALVVRIEIKIEFGFDTFVTMPLRIFDNNSLNFIVDCEILNKVFAISTILRSHNQ